jgi:hypothetical protein
VTNSPPKLGKKILACIRSVLERCEEVGEKIDFPGEGGERRYRAWLNSELLQGTFGWPSKNVLVGERFDLLLVGADDHAVATIETKTPYHKASKKEREDFEERLAGFPTLRTAYFTNGPEWDRLDIVVSGAKLKVLERSSIDIRKASPALAETFFAPLQHRPVDGAQAGQVYQVNKDNPFIGGTLSRLTADLDETVSEFTTFYSQMFFGLREGKAGKLAQDVTSAIYSQWCGKSLRVTPELAARSLQQVLKNEGASAPNVVRTLTSLGLDGPANDQVIEAVMSLAPSRREDEAALAECLWPAFAPSVSQLSAQTAHVILARTLLYRVGEDEKVFSRKLSSGALNKILEGPTSTITGRKFPATELLESVRTEMQTFLPTVYLRGEFDWWAVPPEKRASLETGHLASLRQFDEETERLNKLMLRRLSHYQFESVDVDIWRNIYEHYLPADERQRLGGFYTPDELVNLVLDLGEYVSDRPGLCQLAFIDPASGSGAFVTTALGRLLAHLDVEMPCHAEIKKRGVPEWRSAEQKLKRVEEKLHAIDLHPFASFLTTLNVLFMTLPYYVIARKQDPDFTIDLHIFSADGLERPDRKTEEQMHMFAQMNSRIQLSADSYDRYRRIMDTKFERVFGNPPWGGVLKGRLAPVYDSAKKKHFSKVYPDAAKGKYDIYGLFMERSLQLLAPGGRFALLTQGTYLDKEWARDLRKLLASRTQLDFIVDLNPFGNLFFRAMNSPCVTSAVSTNNQADSGCFCVTSHPFNAFRGLETEQRRKKVVDTIRSVLTKLTTKKHAKVLFASGTRVPQARLRETAKDRWDLSGGADVLTFPKEWFNAAELLEMRQGVTPGGCLDIFLMEKRKADLLKLELDLVHKAIKSKQLEPWRVGWKDRVLFYPYHVRRKLSEPAFTLQWDDVRDEELKQRLLDLKILDALDFDQQIDAREIDIIREGGINRETVPKLLKHRIALGLVGYPSAAAYLVQHYEQLQSRVFKKRNIRTFNRRWYEYLWPRDAKIMLGKPRIISPTLIRTVRFVLDSDGYLSDHACLMMQPTSKTIAAWDRFSAQMKSVLGEVLSKKELLKYCLAFMNSSYAQERLLAGHRPTPKGSYAITEAYLREIPIPTPSSKKVVKAIIKLVDDLEGDGVVKPTKQHDELLRQNLDTLVRKELQAISV